MVPRTALIFTVTAVTIFEKADHSGWREKENEMDSSVLTSVKAKESCMTEVDGESDSTSADARDPAKVEEKIGRILLLFRWLQLPMLFGLGLTLVIFLAVFFSDLASMFDGRGLNRTKIVLLALDLIDMVLIANLMVMVLISGYKIFVARVSYGLDPYVPAWLSGLTLSGVKMRISATVLLISTIHLLHELLDTSVKTMEGALLILAVQLVFIVTTLTFAFMLRWEES